MNAQINIAAFINPTGTGKQMSTYDPGSLGSQILQFNIIMLFETSVRDKRIHPRVMWLVV